MDTQAQDRHAIEAFGQRWLAGWNDHDAAALTAMCHPDIVWEEPAPRRVLRGTGEVGPWIEQNFVAFPDLRIESVHEFADAEAGRAASWWRLTGTHEGPLDPPGFAPTGRRVDINGADFMTFRGGLLVHMRMIYDVSDLAVQLGLAPKPGSPVERALVGMQRTTSRLRR